MNRVTLVSYDFIKNHPLFDKEAERVYKMYSNPYIKIFTIEERRKSVAICIAYDGPDRKILFHFNSHNINLIGVFITYFKTSEVNEVLIYMPKLYQNKYDKIFKKNNFEFIDNVHSYVFVPSYSQNLSFWKEFYSKRGHKVIKYLIDHGCDRCSFEDALNDDRFKDLDLITKLRRKLENNEFDDPLNPFKDNDFDPHYSYIAYYLDDPIAYLTVKNVDNILILDHLSLCKDANHNGVSLILISKFINRVIDDYELESDKYFEVRTKTISEKSSMFHLLEGSLNKIIFQQREKVVYKYKK